MPKFPNKDSHAKHDASARNQIKTRELSESPGSLANVMDQILAEAKTAYEDKSLPRYERSLKVRLTGLSDFSYTPTGDWWRDSIAIQKSLGEKLDELIAERFDLDELYDLVRTIVVSGDYFAVDFDIWFKTRPIPLRRT